MATQNQIFRELKAALCNCPPSRLKEMTAEATNNFSSDQLSRMQDKLTVIQMYISNQLVIRHNKENDIRGMSIEEKYKQQLIRALKKGQINGSLG